MKNQILIALSVIVFNAGAQDTIIKKNGDLIRAKITEIGTEDVKFKIYDAPDGPIITLKKSDIKKATVAGQTIIDVKADIAVSTEDIIVKKTGDVLKVKVTDIGTDEVKFKLFNNPDGPTISILKSDIKTMKVEGQTVIDVKTGLTEDLITKRDRSVIKAKISEMGAEDVKYKLFSNPDGPDMVLKKSQIENIKIDGQIVYEHKEDPLSVSNKTILDRTSAVKFYFFSPLAHNICFGYEWMNKPGFNWDVALGIIGPGVAPNNSRNQTRNPKGVFLRGGPKFLLGNSSDVETGDGDVKIRYSHPLKGRYVKLEMIVNAFSSENSIDTGGSFPWMPPSGKYHYTNRYQSFTLDIQYGRQFILGNAMTLSYYLGIGYSFESKTSTLPDRFKNYYFSPDIGRYSHTYFGPSFPMIFTWGLTVGYILPAPKWMMSKKSHYNYNLPSGRSMSTR